MRVTPVVCVSLTLMLGIAGPALSQDEKPPDYSKNSLAEWIDHLRNGRDFQSLDEACKALGPKGPYAKTAVPELINALRDKNSPGSPAVAQVLADYAPAVVPTLIQALKRPEAEVRAGVAEALGLVRPKATEAVPALADALQDENDQVRTTAVFALSKIGPKAKAAVPALILALKDKQSLIRAGAAQTLERIGPHAKPAVPALIEALKKDSRDHSAVAALGAIGPSAKEAVPLLINALENGDEYLRRRAAWALGNIGPASKPAMPALIAAAKNKRSEDAIRALGKIGADTKTTVPLLIELLTKRETPIFYSVIGALEDIGPEAKAAIPALTAIALDPSVEEWDRRTAAEAVAKIDPALATKTGIETACLDSRLGKVPAIKLHERAQLTEEQKKHIKGLIRKLAEIDSPDFGLSSTFSGRAFAPLPDHFKVGTLVLTDHKVKRSNIFRSLVEQGPNAIPLLLEALDDKTPTKLRVSRMMNAEFGEEMDGNPLNPLEKQRFVAPEDRDREEDDALLRSYSVRVGEVCFVALGQIVGRSYEAVRYQPSASMVINSPVQSKQLCKRVRAVWSSDDPRKKLFDSLLLDYATVGKFNGKDMDGGLHEASNFQSKAAMHLLYYFPKETAPLIAARLRSFDVKEAGDDGHMMREVKNGVRTEDFIKAVAWCTEPDIQKALDDIARRTDDKFIKEVLENRGKKNP